MHCECARFTCLYCVPCGTQGPQSGGVWGGLCCVSALPARPDGSCHPDRRWSNGKKSVRNGGGPQNCAKVAGPQSRHIWRPPAAAPPSPAPSVLSLLPPGSLSPFSPGQEVRTAIRVFCVSPLLAEEEREEGVSEGLRDRSRKTFYFMTVDNKEECEDTHRSSFSCCILFHPPPPQIKTHSFAFPWSK